MKYNLENENAKVCENIGHICLKENDLKQAYLAFKTAYRKTIQAWNGDILGTKEESKLEKQQEECLIKARVIASILHINPNDILGND